MTLNCLEKLRKLEINKNYKMTLIHLSSGLKNGSCYSILGNVNVYTQGREIRTGVNYEMGGTILSKTVKEKDLGVTMNANMKVSEQCRNAASKGNQVIWMIQRNITYKEKSLIIPLYKAIVRPHLEYCIQAWNPYLRKDVDMLEKIQRRATRTERSNIMKND